MDNNFRNKLIAWMNIVRDQDVQHLQDLEWNWEEEIDKFIKDPDETIKEAIFTFAIEDHDYRGAAWAEIVQTQKKEEPKKKSDFINCFGINMSKGDK
mgnify:FL=1